MIFCFFFSSRRRHTRCGRDWSSDVCSSDLRMSTRRRRWPTQRASLSSSSAEHLPRRGLAVSKATTTRQRALRAIAAVSGIALLAYLIWRAGPGNLLRNISTLGWGLALIIALGGVAHLVKTWAWRLTFTGCEGRVSFFRLLQLRLASEAVGTVGALGQIFGEGLRVSALGPNIPIESRISSVTLDRALFIATSALVSLTGILAALLTLPLNPALRRYALLFAVALFGLLFVVVLAMLN